MATSIASAKRVLTVEFDREDDGRWIAEIGEVPGVIVYGGSRDEALHKAQALALRVLADQAESGDLPLESVTFSFA